MRVLKRNRQVFHYATYKGKSPGDEPFTEKFTYDEIKPFMANISPARGQVSANLFGANLNYDKVIVMDNSAPAVDEHTVFWIDKVPTETQVEDAEPYDYVVAQIAKSLNNIAIAIKRVDVN